MIKTITCITGTLVAPVFFCFGFMAFPMREGGATFTPNQSSTSDTPTYSEDFENAYPNRKPMQDERPGWVFDVQTRPDGNDAPRHRGSPYGYFLMKTFSEAKGNTFARSSTKIDGFQTPLPEDFGRRGIDAWYYHEPRSDGGAICQLAMLTHRGTDIVQESAYGYSKSFDLCDATISFRFRDNNISLNEHKLHFFIIGHAPDTHYGNQDKSSHNVGKFVTYLLTNTDLRAIAPGNDGWKTANLNLIADLNLWTGLGVDWQNAGGSIYGFCPDQKSFANCLKEHVVHFGVAAFRKRTNPDTDFHDPELRNTPKGDFDIDDVTINVATKK